MQIRTGTEDGIARLVMELGETLEISFYPRIRTSREEKETILRLVIGTREFLDGEMSLTVTMPSGSTYESDYSDDNGDYLSHLITSNLEEGKQFCGAACPGQDRGIVDTLVDALEHIQARISEMKNQGGKPSGV